MTEPIIPKELSRSPIAGGLQSAGWEPQAQAMRFRVDLLMLSVSLIWGFNFAVMKGLYVYFDPLAFTALRFVFAVPVLIVFLKLRGLPLRVEVRDLPAIIGLGILANTLYQILFISGLALTKAGNAALLTAATPVFAYLSGLLFKRERFSRNVLAGILLSIAGVGTIVLFGATEVALGANWRGDLMILASALSWGWYTGAAARLLMKYGALRLTLWVMLTGTLLLIPPLLPSMMHQDWLSIPPMGWAGFAYSTFLSIVYGYLVWSYALHQVGISRTAIFSNMTPVIALLGSWMLLGEKPALAQFTGVVLILGGIFIVRSKWTPIAGVKA